MASELEVIKESEIRSAQTQMSLSQKLPAIDTLAPKFSILSWNASPCLRQ